MTIRRYTMAHYNERFLILEVQGERSTVVATCDTFLKARNCISNLYGYDAEEMAPGEPRAPDPETVRLAIAAWRGH